MIEVDIFVRRNDWDREQNGENLNSKINGDAVWQNLEIRSTTNSAPQK